jgi:tetratricopeptide (TPR) repeat protein
VSAEEIAARLAEAKDLFAQREELENLKRAVEITSALRDPQNRNFEIEWNFAKYSYFLSKQLKTESEKEQILARGRDAGRIASRLEPNKPEGHFWYGTNLGELAKLSPITVGVKAVDEIRSAMERVIELDPAYQGASAFDALAQVELATRLFGGKAERAVELLEQGLKKAPDNSYIRVNLGEAYLAVRRDSEARKMLESVISMKPDPTYRFEHAEAVEKARRLISRNF